MTAPPASKVPKCFSSLNKYRWHKKILRDVRPEQLVPRFDSSLSMPIASSDHQVAVTSVSPQTDRTASALFGSAGTWTSLPDSLPSADS